MKIVVMERDGSYVDIISVTKEFWKNELPKFLVEAEYKEEGESMDEEELVDGFLICWCQYDLDNIYYSVIEDDNYEVTINHLTTDDYEH